jgi:hypothetical protein
MSIGPGAVRLAAKEEPMEFVLLIVGPRDEPGAEIVPMSEMSAFAKELGARGKMRGGAPLHEEAEGVRLARREGRVVATDGPFAECKEVVAGFFVVDAANREEAIEIAKRCPAARGGVIEVRRAPDRDVVADAGPGPRWLMLLHMPPDLTDDDDACYRAMVAYDGVLKQEGSYVESSQLALDDPAPARIQVRGGKPLVTDGPFAEAKEVAGGFYIVRAATRADAIEIAKRCPHLGAGEIEVREVLPAA